MVFEYGCLIYWRSMKEITRCLLLLNWFLTRWNTYISMVFCHFSTIRGNGEHRNYLGRSTAVLNVMQNGFLAYRLIIGWGLRLQWDIVPLLWKPCALQTAAHLSSEFSFYPMKANFLNRYMTPFSSFLLDFTFVGGFSQEFEETFNTLKERSLKWKTWVSRALAKSSQVLQRGKDGPLCCRKCDRRPAVPCEGARWQISVLAVRLYSISINQ